jgi:hypothetical protein
VCADVIDQVPVVVVKREHADPFHFHPDRPMGNKETAVLRITNAGRYGTR